MSASRASRPSIERHATGCWSERPSCATRWRLWRQQGASYRPADILDERLLSSPHGDRYVVGEQVTAVHEDAVEASITTERLTKAEASPSSSRTASRITSRGASCNTGSRSASASATLTMGAWTRRRRDSGAGTSAAAGARTLRWHSGPGSDDRISEGPSTARLSTSTTLPLDVGGFSSLEDMGLVLDLSGAACVDRGVRQNALAAMAPRASPDASAHHAVAIQAPHPPVSRRSRLTATPPDQTAQPSPRLGGQILNRHLVGCQPAPASERFDATASATSRSGRVLTGAVG